MCALQLPFARFSPEPFKAAIANGEREKIKKKWPEPLKELLNHCWHVESSQRPEFSQIVPKLDMILYKLNPALAPNEEIWA